MNIRRGEGLGRIGKQCFQLSLFCLHRVLLAFFNSVVIYTGIIYTYCMYISLFPLCFERDSADFRTKKKNTDNCCPFHSRTKLTCLKRKRARYECILVLPRHSKRPKHQRKLFRIESALSICWTSPSFSMVLHEIKKRKAKKS